MNCPRWHDATAWRDTGHPLSENQRRQPVRRVELRQRLALDPHQGGRLRARGRPGRAAAASVGVARGPRPARSRLPEPAAGRGASGALVDDGLQFNERRLDKDLAAEKTRKTIDDALLDEAVSILSDSAALKEGQSQVAASALPIRPELVVALPKGSSEK